MGTALTGTHVSAIALPWFVLVTTGSAAQTGLLASCEMAPYVAVKAFAGPVVDRAGPRVVSWTTDVLSAIAAVTVPLLYSAGRLDFGVLLGLVALIGAARGPGDLAKEIMVPEAAERARVPLERATGLSGVTERLASTVGPAAGGALVALLGPMTALTAIAGCFAAGSVIIALCLPRGMGLPVRPETDGQQGGYWKRFGEGFGFLRSEPLLLTVVATIAVTNLLDAAFRTVLLPVWAKESGNGPGAIGLSVAVMGAAAVAGSLIAAVVAHRMRRRLVFFTGFLLAGAPRFAVLALDVPLWAVAAVFAVSGFGAGFLNPILGALLFERVPRRLLGRVGALGDAAAWSGIPLGGLAAGVAVGSLGLVPSLLAAGAAYFLTTGLAGLRPEWRRMDRLRAARQSGASGAAPPREEPPQDPLPAGEP